MPITASATKALRQSVTKRALNLRRKDRYKTSVKDFKKAITAKDFDKAKSLLPTVYKTLDKASKNQVIKKNKSSRLKSRLTQLLNKTTTAKA